LEEVNLIFPNQLFENSPLFDYNVKTYLIEEYLFFNQLKFHKKKILFHRVSMKKYHDYCLDHFNDLEYINSYDKNSDIRVLLDGLLEKNIKQINYLNPCDNWLEKRINNKRNFIKLNRIESLQYLNSETDNHNFFSPSKKKYFQTSFYKLQRKKMNILMDGDHPQGEKWTYDDENRKKYPKSKIPPPIKYPKKEKKFYEESINYVNLYFGKNYGVLNGMISYPTDYKSAKNWFNDFLNERFEEFGDYEDAIVEKEAVLNHSLLSPLINSGLLTPKYVVDEINKYAIKKNIRINSFEGIIRQIIGWREFIRGIYRAKGSFERTRNYWNFNKKMPASFYNASTGIKPVDDCINKAIKNAYLHHIERLMIVGNFMFLCEIDPDCVYKWFMEFFIDSYDWVMVPNVYGMSQFADGGLMSTKPYISSSNYIMKMSDYKKGDWQKIWDGLYWRFIYKNQSFFKSNPRLSMMVRTLNKMDKEKLKSHLEISEEYLSKLK
tara:strand:+ start:2391 stop:3866 length:1476 start_codon:yes stop_codon:yes gene_type:complete